MRAAWPAGPLQLGVRRIGRAPTPFNRWVVVGRSLPVDTVATALARPRPCKTLLSIAKKREGLWRESRSCVLRAPRCFGGCEPQGNQPSLALSGHRRAPAGGHWVDMSQLGLAISLCLVELTRLELAQRGIRSPAAHLKPQIKCPREANQRRALIWWSIRESNPPTVGCKAPDRYQSAPNWWSTRDSNPPVLTSQGQTATVVPRNWWSARESNPPVLGSQSLTATKAPL